MSKYTFKQEDDGIITTIELEADAAYEVVEAFRNFLLGCGFMSKTVEEYLNLE